MTAKEYLNQAKRIDKDIQLCRDQIDNLRGIAIYKSPNLKNNSSHSNSNNSAEDKIIKLVEYENRKEKLINKLIDKRNEIECVIDHVASPIQREILKRKYLLNEPFESHYDSVSGKYVKGIAEKIGYSVRWTIKLHGYALREVEKIINSSP